MNSTKRRVYTVSWILPLLLTLPGPARPDEQDRLLVALQPDGRIVVPTNQILKPAGRQVTFPGRPVDLAFADDGRTLVVKNLRDLVFIDIATGKVKQTLPLSRRPDSKLGFSVVGLVVAGAIYVTDAENHVHVAEAQEDGKYAWQDMIPLQK